MTSDLDSSDRGPDDVTRRTRLAAERTWLAWLRTGIGASAVAIAVGRVLPGLTGGAKWPFRVLGIGYALLAVLVLVVGATRQRGVEESLRRGEYARLSTALVMILTAGGIALATGTLILVSARL